LCQFKHHTKKVTSISMHPKEDQFLSTAKDGSMALWDIKNEQLTGVIKRIPTNCRASFDHKGENFALAYQDEAAGKCVLNLYDNRS